MSALVPAQKACASQSSTFADHVGKSSTDIERLAQCPLALVKTPQERKQISLSQVDLSQSGAVSGWFQNRKKFIDEFLLFVAGPERLMQSFQFQQNFDQRLLLGRIVRGLGKPMLGHFQNCERFRELTLESGSFR